MQRAKIGEMKNKFSRYLDHVREGGEVLVFDRDRPVARLVPVSRPTSPGVVETPDEARLASLERRGLVRRGSAETERGTLPPPIRLKGGLLADLLADREAGW